MATNPAGYPTGGPPASSGGSGGGGSSGGGPPSALGLIGGLVGGAGLVGMAGAYLAKPAPAGGRFAGLLGSAASALDGVGAS